MRRSAIRGIGLGGAILAGWLAASAQAAEPAPAPAPGAYQALVECRGITDPTARLACFDKAAEGLAAAVQSRQVVVVDKGTMRETKRRLFGISLPNVKLFGPADDEEIDQIASTIESTSDTRDGLSLFVLADGSRWRQTEGRYLFPKAGQPIVIKRAALGSFMANVNGKTAVRVVRILAP